METKQQKHSTAPKWAVRLKRELRETRKEHALETSRKQAADLFITQMGLWDDFKKWRAENTGLKNDPVPSIFDEMNRIAGERNYWRVKAKTNEELAKVYEDNAEWWIKQGKEKNEMMKTILNHCDYLMKEYDELRQKLNNKEA